MKKFNRLDFFPIKERIMVSDLNNLINDEIISESINKNFEIDDISSLNEYRKNSIIFLEKHIKDFDYLPNNIHIITNLEQNLSHHNNYTHVNDLNISYNKILNKLFYHEDQIEVLMIIYILMASYISKLSNIDKEVEIGKNSIISRGVQIGKNCIIKNNVVIKNSLIGENVTICDNTSIGTSGFGFDLKKRGSSFLNPQIGVVIIENNVHLGANCTVDRGKIDFTRIGKNSMIDNMVHIAHNVIIGENACIAAQTGISGSVYIGNNVTIGGQVGFAGHIKIGDNVVIAAKSGVTKNISDNSVVAGFPAIDIKEWKKNIINQKKYGH